MAETRKGLANLDEILDTGELDSVFIDPGVTQYSARWSTYPNRTALTSARQRHPAYGSSLATAVRGLCCTRFSGCSSIIASMLANATQPVTVNIAL